MANIIEVTAQNPEAVKLSIFDHIINFFVSYWWVGLIIIVLLALILWGLWTIVKKLKQTKYPIYQLYCERRSIAKQHRDNHRFKSWFKPHKNHKITCQYLENGILKQKVIGYYYGDYYSNEGNHNIAFFQRGLKQWLIFPVIKVLLLNKKPSVSFEIEKIDKKTKIKTVEIITQNLPTNIDYFTEEEIILMGCKSIDKIDEESLFYVPILASNKADGSQIDLSSYAYQQLTEVIKGEQLISSLNYFVQANKRALEINPMIRTTDKLGDSSNRIEEQDK